MSHALARAKERISADIPDALLADLRIALANPDKWSAYIEPVIGLRDDAMTYRFRVEQGIFYCIARNGYPVTILTQEQMKSKKRITKASRQRPGWFKREKVTAI